MCCGMCCGIINYELVYPSLSFPYKNIWSELNFLTLRTISNRPISRAINILKFPWIYSLLKNYLLFSLLGSLILLNLMTRMKNALACPLIIFSSGNWEQKSSYFCWRVYRREILFRYLKHVQVCSMFNFKKFFLQIDFLCHCCCCSSFNFFSFSYSTCRTPRRQASFNPFILPIKSFASERECDFMFKKSFCQELLSHLVLILSQHTFWIHIKKF